MGWEPRRGGGVYFYHSIRRGHRVVRRYFGRGPAAEYAAEILDLRRQEQREEQRQEQQRQEDYLALANAASDYLDFSAVILRSVLLAAGMHRHDRGAWRTGRERRT